jgi:hypothetical protein
MAIVIHIFPVKIHQNLINGLGYTADSLFMILHKIAFITDQNGRELEFV